MVNELEKIKEKLRKLRKIIFTKHAIIRHVERKISRNEIEGYLYKPKSLSRAIPQKSEFIDEEKYKLFFKLSKNKTLILIVSFRKESLYVITTFIKYIKLDRKVKVWRKKQW